MLILATFKVAHTAFFKKTSGRKTMLQHENIWGGEFKVI